VVIVNAGSPVLLPWREEVSAIAAVWFPGQEFGHALADILSGDVEPGGRLPVTWPAAEDEALPSVKPSNGALEYSEGLHVGHRGWHPDGPQPAYAFGHGLGYTTWQLRSLAVERPEDERLHLRVAASITNTGPRAGKSVVQMYQTKSSPSTVDRPMQWLAGFASVWLEAAAPREGSYLGAPGVGSPSLRTGPR
jgi:beta-glucosidase